MNVSRWFKFCSGQKPFNLVQSKFKKTQSEKVSNVSKESKSDGKKVYTFHCINGKNDTSDIESLLILVLKARIYTISSKISNNKKCVI